MDANAVTVIVPSASGSSPKAGTHGYGSRRLLRSAGTTICRSERSTNLRLCETTAGAIPLFPDCYLQWTPQLQRVARNRAAEAQITSSVLSSVSP